MTISVHIATGNNHPFKADSTLRGCINFNINNSKNFTNMKTNSTKIDNNEHINKETMTELDY